MMVMMKILAEKLNVFVEVVVVVVVVVVVIRRG